MKIIKTKKQLDKAFDNMEKGKTDLLIKVNPKNTRDNRIHKEGFDAGVLKERKRITKLIKSLDYCKFYIGKNPADKRYKVYLKSEVDGVLDNL